MHLPVPVHDLRVDFAALEIRSMLGVLAVADKVREQLSSKIKVHQVDFLGRFGSRVGAAQGDGFSRLGSDGSGSPTGPNRFAPKSKRKRGLAEVSVRGTT